MSEGEQVPKEEQKPKEEKKSEEEKEQEKEQESEEQQKQKDNFPVVGIGASAGGLSAFEAFFSGIPADVNPGVAFVLVQHLDPKHKSILTTLIGRFTKMPVYEVENNMAVEPNCVYVIPPNYDMIYSNGALYLLPPTEPHGFRTPIDFFFRSLAEGKKERAIGIVLSGTGSDGTLGARAIKAEGGMVMVQSPESSEYNSMPRSVIEAGLADYILPPKEMPAQLITYVTRVFGKIAHPAVREEDLMSRIFNIVFIQTGHDFSNYKKGTIIRRIERRMAVNNMKSLEEYVRYLEQKPAEVETLYRDFLISVTSFFRDPKAFDALSEKVIPNLFVGKRPNDTIRIWVPGSSSGEEAYSIGILIQEYMEAMRRNFKIQIFATDIDSRAIEQARTGRYPASIAADVSPERLDRFFTHGPDGYYTIRKSIRDTVIFSEHDLIKDPPFSKLDLLSCRNVLIYMDEKLQKRLIPLFYYALIPGKYLFLGSAETINGFTELFDTLDSHEKMYQSRQNVGNEYLRSLVPFVPSRLELKEAHGKPEAIAIQSRPKYREIVESILLQNYAPAGVLVDEKGDILYIHGRTGMYLEPGQGEAGFTILKMAREGLQQRLTLALHRAIANKKQLFYPELQVKTNGDFVNVNLSIIPVAATSYAEEGPDLFLVIFEELPKYTHKKTGERSSEDEKEGAEGAKEVDQRILELMTELQTKDEELKAANEELETSTEELKSSNEEMQSVNEELLSSNEELESSKEELQSLNEELATVNSELQSKVAELSQANNDITNMLSGTDIGIIFVDFGMRIMRFTPSVTNVVNLISTDVGRPIGDIVPNFVGDYRLTEDVEEVLDKLTTKETEVQTKDGRWYLMRIKPYRTLENAIKGAVITFTEITKRKLAEEALLANEKQMAADLEAMKRLHQLGTLFVREGNLEPVLGEIVDAAIAISGADFGNIQLLDPISSHLTITAQHGFPEWYLDFWNDVYKGKGTCGTAVGLRERVIVEDVEKSPIFIGTHALEIQLKAGVRAVQSTPLLSRSGKTLGVFSTHYKAPHRPDDHTLQLIDMLARHAADIIEKAQIEESLRKNEERYRTLVTASSETLYRMSPDWNEMRQLNSRGFLADTENPSRTWLQEYILPEDQPYVIAAINEAIRKKTIFELEHRVIKADGSVGWTYSRAVPLFDANGEIVEWFGAANDITERKKAEEGLKKANEALEEKCH